MALVVNTSAMRLGVALGLFAALSSCGGGGGSGVSSTPTPAPGPSAGGTATPTTPTTPTVPAVNYDTAEYQRSTGSVSMNAIAAYNAGATGKDVTVAVLDSGIKTDSPEFTGRISSASRDIAGSPSRGIQDTAGHGTAISAVIGAARNGSGNMGVAFESKLLALRTDKPGSCDSGECSHLDGDLAVAVDTAVANGARVINMSLGGSVPAGVLVDAIGRAAAAGIVVVISAGNDNAANPDDFALVANRASSRNMVIIAGSHTADGTSLSSFSNAAGIGQDHYLVALGESVRTIDHNGTAVLGSGTSFSAPQVSGAAALLAQAFPNLTGAQIVNLLFDSALDLGATGTDSVFGRGKLSLTRAFQPQGQTSLASTAAPLSLASNGSLGAPMGDAGQRGAALGGAIILDGYSRAYAVDLAATLSRTPVNSGLARHLTGSSRSYSGGNGKVMVSVSVHRDAANARPWVGMAQTGMSAEDTRVARATAGAIISRISPNSRVAFGFSDSGLGLIDRMSGRSTPAFLVAGDPRATPGFEYQRGNAVAVQHSFGRADFSMSIENGDAIMWQRRREMRAPYSLASLSMSYDLGALNLNLGAGVLEESNSVLGSQLSPAFGVGGATTRLADAAAMLNLSRKWRFTARVRQGWTTVKTSGGLVDKADIITRGFAADLTGEGVFSTMDRLGLRVAQPLRVENGGFNLNVPVSYDYLTGTTGIESRRMSLTPTGREIDVEASYGLPMAGGWIDANLYWRRDPGHIASAPNDKGVALRYSLGF